MIVHMARTARMKEAHQLSAMMIDIAEQSKADFAEIAASLGLHVILARAIALLDTPAPMRDLAESLACDRSYITGIADQLEERGLVERIPGTDRRVKLLQLTDEGAAVRDRLAESVADRALVMRRLTNEQRANLKPLLEALLKDPQDS